MRLFDLGEGLHRPDARSLFSFAPQRSGQHVVIDWICRGMGEILHFNHCRLYLRPNGVRLYPMTGRVTVYRNAEAKDLGKLGRRHTAASLGDFDCPYEFYSVEDVLPLAPGYRTLCARYGDASIVILRDPANWLASTLRHPKSTTSRVRSQVRLLEDMLDFAIRRQNDKRYLIINFNSFIKNSDYRMSLANRLELASFNDAEKALGAVPDFGGGSSFGGRRTEARIGVEDRWRQYASHPLFLEVLARPRLRQLGKQFFGDDYVEVT